MTSKILELDTVLGHYAWQVLQKKVNFMRRYFLTETEYYAEVDWKCLSIEHNVMKFSLRPEGKEVVTAWGTINTGSRWVSLYGCDYQNDTDVKQVHRFQGKRETTTWIAVELNNCFTIDKNVNLNVNLPPNFVKLRAGRDNSMTVCKMKGEVFKEIMPWEVNSQIEVVPGWKAHAELLAREECHVIDFEIQTRLSVPKGKLPVHFKRKSDNSMAYTVELDDFHNAFLSQESGGILDENEMSLVQVLMESTLDPDGKENSNTSIQLTSQGTCDSVTWSNQRVDIKTEPLSKGHNINSTQDDDLYTSEFLVKQVTIKE